MAERMAAETEALGRCTECGKTYTLYEDPSGWRALGTDGSCRCGNEEFTVLSGD
jgi:hypothetical protein